MANFTHAELMFLFATWAYEINDRPFISDKLWDEWAIKLEPSLKDKIPSYDPCTGLWIHTLHPMYKDPEGEFWKKLWPELIKDHIKQLK